MIYGVQELRVTLFWLEISYYIKSLFLILWLKEEVCHYYSFVQLYYCYIIYLLGFSQVLNIMVLRNMFVICLINVMPIKNDEMHYHACFLLFMTFCNSVWKVEGWTTVFHFGLKVWCFGSVLFILAFEFWGYDRGELCLEF